MIASTTRPERQKTVVNTWSRDYASSPLSHPTIFRALGVRFKAITGCEDLQPMLIRYRLLATPWGSLNIHRFLRSDVDRAMHDHPFAFASIVLRGSYTECVPTGDQCFYFADGTPLTYRFERKSGDILYRPATFVHRVELRPGATAWTLIFIGRKIREWGFHTVAGWLPWRKYHATAGCAGEEMA